MSGVEATGLVLGAFPLIIEAIKVYSNGASTIRRYIKYQHPLSNLCDELTFERALFENVCEELLDGLIEDHIWKATLLKDPGGEAWKEKVLEEKLEDHLHGSLYEVYLKAMRDMKQAVAEIQELLKLGEDNKVQINANDRFDKEKEKLKFSIKPKHNEDSVAQIRRSTKRLKEATRIGTKIEARTNVPLISQNPLRETDLDFKTIQNGASRVYNIIRGQLQCSCRSSHVINLELEPHKRLAARVNCDTGRVVQPSFRVLFSYGVKGSPADTQPWKMEAVEIFPDEDEPNNLAFPGKRSPEMTTSATKKVQFLDETIVSVTNTKKVDFASNILGSLCISPSNICLQQLLQGAHAILLTEKLLNPKPGTSQSTTSLQSSPSPDLLSLREVLLSDSTGQYRRRFSNLVKLRLSVSLAWSLLQLHQTPWFCKTWTNSDISLLDHPHYSLLDQPFISRTVSEESEAHHGQLLHHSTSARPRNGALFALGVLLIELCLGAPFDKLREPQELKVLGLPDTCSDYEVADCLIEEVYDKFGDTYGDAVLKCIRCEFGCRRNSLDDERFRRAFYTGVIVLLEQNLEVFRSH